MAAASNKRKASPCWNDLVPDVKRHITTMVIRNAAHTSSMMARQHGVLEDQRRELMSWPRIHSMRREWTEEELVTYIRDQKDQMDSTIAKMRDLIDNMKKFKAETLCITSLLLGICKLSNEEDLRIVKLVNRLNG